MTDFTPPPDDVVLPMSHTMDFPDAMKKIIEGKKVARISWGNTDYCLLKDGMLTIYTKGGFHLWTISDGDMEGQDWIAA